MKEESIDASDDRFCARSIVTRFRTRSFVRRSRPRISDVPFSSLPENCIACILSFTSPRDTCRLATLSSRFRSAAESDQVWTKFLSSDYQDVLSRIDASDPVHLSSKREIFFGLNDHILIDGGKKSIAIDKTTGKICLMISAKEVDFSQHLILLDEYPSWDYHTLDESRFTDVVIHKICRDMSLCLHAELKTNQLSDNTTYVVYLVYKLKVHDFDDDEPVVGDAMMIDISLGDDDDDEDTVSESLSSLFSKKALDQAGKHFSEEAIQTSYYFPNVREGRRWMEVVLGEFDNNNDFGNEKVFVKCYWFDCVKLDFVIEGIEFRPKIF
ncbi:hypothetical protein ZOSMA_150G00280 [Zostera marina]|uniref:F-box domain-containing protein n=1 Tax=Zostera marina TaxID=29655 RepID=A0A0K9PYD2_ZOSMR|nr:hypothetical protein ZOSMA_150G00280 [Zostera marina]